jgi:hypothetical protein
MQYAVFEHMLINVYIRMSMCASDSHQKLIRKPANAFRIPQIYLKVISVVGLHFDAASSVVTNSRPPTFIDK